MQHIADYLDRGGPVVGFRTATHAFQIKRPDAKFLKYHWQTGEDYPGGFGRQILGETWVSHYGTNHKQSSRLLLQADQADASDPARREGRVGAVGRLHGESDRGQPVLATGQILDGMTPDSPPADGQGADAGRLVSHLHQRVRQVGTRVHDHARRVGGSAERRLPADVRQRVPVGRRPREQHPARRRHQLRRSVSSPTTFTFGGFVKGVKPADLAGWDSPILPKA